MQAASMTPAKRRVPCTHRVVPQQRCDNVVVVAADGVDQGGAALVVRLARVGLRLEQKLDTFCVTRRGWVAKENGKRVHVGCEGRAHQGHT